LERKAELFWGAPLWLFPSGKIGPYYGKWYSLNYVIKGVALLKTKEMEITIRKGDYFCMPADMVFEILPLGGKNFGYYDFKFFLHDPFLRKNLQHMHPPRSADTALKEMLDYLMENWSAQDLQNQQSCENLLISLLLLLFMGQMHYEKKDSRFILAENYNKTTQKILHYAETHYFEPFSLEKLGAELNYNKNYLCAVFSKNVGISIVDYINFLKMRKAIGSFLYYSYDVATTAEGLGFNSTDYFGRIFKRFLGVTPRDFYKAVSSLSAEERSKFNEEPLLTYRPCTIEEALDSMRHIGESVLELKKRQETDK